MEKISPEARKKGGGDEGERGGGGRKKIRAATLIFDVIKRHSPQPVDDITLRSLVSFFKRNSSTGPIFR